MAFAQRKKVKDFDARRRLTYRFRHGLLPYPIVVRPPEQTLNREGLSLKES